MCFGSADFGMEVGGEECSGGSFIRDDDGYFFLR